MYLKSMNIIGFKTFADETEILFDPGFTAVVGPNGSGKSNIVDAMKWVLGEKSAKGLRGEKMDDVIFHGSENREPSGFAEVTVTLDNSRKIFPIDFPTVKITRRVYPDMVNEYLINNVKSLRKDVEKLLLDTGVGKSSYSIMEQGRVEAILNSKPEDRRAIFDEAAGISRYKMDKLETEKKLDLTKQNLLRITDILSSMEKELDLKQRQAEKAKQYFELKTKLSEADKNLRYLKMRSLKNRSKKIESELEEIKIKNEDLLVKIKSETVLLEARESEKNELEHKISEIDKKLYDFFTKREVQKEKIDKNKSIIEEYIQRIDENKQALAEDRTRLEFSEIELNQFIEDKKNLLLLIADTQSLIEKAILERKILEEKIDSENQIIKSSGGNISENDKRHTILREKLKDSILSLINQIEEKKLEAEKSEPKRIELKKILFDSLEIFIQKYEMNTDFATIIADLNPKFYRDNLKELLNLEDIFRDILLDKDGLLARKESIDSEIEDIILNNENLSRKISESNSNLELIRSELESLREGIVNSEKYVLETEGKILSKETEIEKEEKNISERKLKMDSIASSISQIEIKLQTYKDEVTELEIEIEKSYNEFLGMSKILETEKDLLKKLLSEIQDLKNSSTAANDEFRTLIPLMNEHERKAASIKTQLESFLEELYNEYSITDSDLETEKSSQTIKQEQEETKLRDAKSEMQILGSINPMAIEEYQNVKDIYEHHQSQKKDIENSKDLILAALKNINIESEKIFIETFEIIKNNFAETFAILFNGGRATIELTDKDDKLNSGIEIIAEPPGKHVQNLKLLSGGEKSMTVIALLFAIYMVKPSPFCFLDEIDAALDEVNKLRFCQILDRFKDMSQFIVVTHAPPTISRANTIFGVTSSEPGVSRVISLKIDEAKTFVKKAV